MVWTAETSHGNESKKIRWDIVPYTRGRGLDLGAGIYKAFPHFISVDNGNHEQFGWNIKPDVIVETCEKLDMFASHSMDFVFSSHLLEHIHDYKSALKEWWRLIKPNGYLVLYLPHKEFYPNCGEVGANPDHKHDYLPNDIMEAMKDNKSWDLVENQERNEADEYSFFQVYKKIGGTKNIHSWKKEKPQKTAAVIRYGAFGDLMQASSVFSGLKAQGYHVTLYSTLPGASVVTLDPNLDQIILQDKDQVPNQDLGEFWKHLEKKYDKLINLSESVEGTFLALPGRTAHAWPKEVRHEMMNANYIEFQHKLASVPHAPKVKFYASDAEKSWAKKQRSKMGETVILWSLAGSSVHKTWPHIDTIIARTLIDFPNSTIVLCGGPECAILEAGWEKEPRVIKTCGKWSIRESLAFLAEADIVVGPETGVLNAASHMPMPKIVFLSHSSVNNLSRDWVNTESLFTTKAECYPCHMLHYGWTHCVKDEETATAKCQSTISADDCWSALRPMIIKHQEQAA